MLLSALCPGACTLHVRRTGSCAALAMCSPPLHRPAHDGGREQRGRSAPPCCAHRLTQGAAARCLIWTVAPIRVGNVQVQSGHGTCKAPSYYDAPRSSTHICPSREMCMPAYPLGRVQPFRHRMNVDRDCPSLLLHRSTATPHHPRHWARCLPQPPSPCPTPPGPLPAPAHHLPPHGAHTHMAHTQHAGGTGPHCSLAGGRGQCRPRGGAAAPLAGQPRCGRGPTGAGGRGGGGGG